MTIRDRIDSDYTREVKARNAAAVSALRMLRTALKYAEIEKMKPLEDADVVDVVAKEVKKLNDAMESYRTGGRADLVEKTEAELSVFKTYLPEPLGDDDLKRLISEKIAAAGAVTIKDFGRIMSEVTKVTKGRADGAKVSAMVKTALSGGGT